MASIKLGQFELPAPAKNQKGQPVHFQIKDNCRPEISVRDGKAFITVVEYTSANPQNRFGGWFIIVADGEEFHESRADPGGIMRPVYFRNYVASYTLNGTIYHLVGCVER
jgi:hypothetical protein